MKRILITIAALSLIIASLVTLWNIAKSRTFQFFGEIVPRVHTSEKVVALTFDDGPTPKATDELLSILQQENIHATFFVIGGDLKEHLVEGKKIVAAGHELGNDSYSHQPMLLVTPSFVREEIEATDSLIRETGYQGAIHFRPPYGKKLFALPYYLSKTGRKTITWDVEPDSYPEVAARSEKIVEHVLSKTQPGSIIILHVMYSNGAPSMKAVRGIVDGLKAKGYSFKKVSELLAVER